MKTGNMVDQARSVIESLASIAGTLGPIASGLASALQRYAAEDRFKNIEETLDALQRRLEQLPVGSFEETLSSKPFVHLCVNAIEKSQKEHRRYKRHLFGLILANAAGNSPFNFERSDHFIELLDNLDQFDISVLGFLGERGVLNSKSGERADFNTIAALANGRIAREMVRFSIQKLERYCVLKTSGGTGALMVGTNPTGLWHKSRFSITETGMQFLHHMTIDGKFLQELFPGDQKASTT